MASQNNFCFYPWVGDLYKYGIKFDDNKQLQFGTEKNHGKENGFYKVMILGCDHYCVMNDKGENLQVQNRNKEQSNYIATLKEILTKYKNNELQTKISAELANISAVSAVCEMHENKCDECGKLPICQYKTMVLIADYLYSRTDRYSHKKFRPTIGGDFSLWDHLLFANFFQRAMPNQSDKYNVGYMNTSAQEIGARAFMNIFQTYTPDVIIMWGHEYLKSFLWKQGIGSEAATKELNKNGYSFNLMKDSGTDYQMPRLRIGDNTVSFTILKHDEKTVSLVLLTDHPSHRGYSSNKTRENLVYAFKHYTELLNWSEQLEKVSAPKTYVPKF